VQALTNPGKPALHIFAWRDALQGMQARGRNSKRTSAEPAAVSAADASPLTVRSARSASPLSSPESDTSHAADGDRLASAPAAQADLAAALQREAGSAAAASEHRQNGALPGFVPRVKFKLNLSGQSGAEVTMEPHDAPASAADALRANGAIAGRAPGDTLASEQQRPRIPSGSPVSPVSSQEVDNHLRSTRCNGAAHTGSGAAAPDAEMLTDALAPTASDSAALAGAPAHAQASRRSHWDLKQQAQSAGAAEPERPASHASRESTSPSRGAAAVEASPVDGERRRRPSLPKRRRGDDPPASCTADRAPKHARMEGRRGVRSPRGSRARDRPNVSGREGERGSSRSHERANRARGSDDGSRSALMRRRDADAHAPALQPVAVKAAQQAPAVEEEPLTPPSSGGAPLPPARAAAQPANGHLDVEMSPVTSEDGAAAPDDALQPGGGGTGSAGRANGFASSSAPAVEEEPLTPPESALLPLSRCMAMHVLML
jgi:hypothetical protein